MLVRRLSRRCPLRSKLIVIRFIRLSVKICFLQMAFKRYRASGYRRRFSGRRFARGRRRLTTRSRRVYNPRGTNPNQIIELKNVDYHAGKAITMAGSDTYAPIAWASASFPPTRVLSGTTGVSITGTTPPWNAVSQGINSNQRDGRKINCVKLLLKYGINVRHDSGCSLNPSSILHVMVVLDTATNLAVPASMDALITCLQQGGDTAALDSGPSMFPFPNPSGVNRFRILKHKIHRPSLANYDATAGALVPVIVGQMSIDLKGLPTTFVQGGATTPQTATISDVVDNSIHLLIFQSSFRFNNVPSYWANVCGRLLFTG